MELRHEIVSSITFKTTRYPYKLNPDGTRNINRDFDKDEDFLFKFSIAELSLIIFRDAPNRLNIDGKEMYFDYNNGKLIGIHFENEDYIWFVKNYSDLLEECKRLFAYQYVALEYLSRSIGNQIGDTSSDIIDEYLDEDDEVIDEFDLDDEDD